MFKSLLRLRLGGKWREVLSVRPVLLPAARRELCRFNALFAALGNHEHQGQTRSDRASATMLLEWLQGPLSNGIFYRNWIQLTGKNALKHVLVIKLRSVTIVFFAHTSWQKHAGVLRRRADLEGSKFDWEWRPWQRSWCMCLCVC